MREKRYIGIDLHRRRFTCCVRLASGRNYLSEWNLQQLPEFAKRLRPTDEGAVEVTGNTRLFYEAVAPHVERVVVVDPNQFRVISHSVKKTDLNDARNLALYLAKGLLPEVRMKEQPQAEVASLTQTRDRLVKLRTALKNKVNNLLSARGIELEKEDLPSEKGLERVLGHDGLEGLAQVELEIIVEEIRSLNRNIRRLEEVIEEAARKLPGYTNLTSIKGIGALGAGVLLSVIGDVKDFPEEGKLASYFGIVPRVQNSNETEHRGRITKRGTKLGRTTLVQCALIAKRYSPYLNRYYEGIRARRGTGKAIIALARKFLGIVYTTLKNNWVFEDFPNFVLAEVKT
ncbi:MAG TPA: IS110 family transposase [Candidatus Sulfotelmatobacter sp.]|jgi:transposase|nr:IS110 family transposase [Candidatus Sulfotelmatobacter sp.]